MFDIILYICKRLRAFGIISFSFFLVACGLETNRLTDGQGEYMADPVQVALLIPRSQFRKCRATCCRRSWQSEN